MSISEEELDRIIKNHLSEELDSNIEVPDIDNQWQKIKQQILMTDNIHKTQKRFPNQKQIVVAAVIVISIGAITFSYPNNANAFGGKIAEFFNYIVGKTTQNKTETYKQDDESGVPKVQDEGNVFEKEVNLEQAQNSVPYKLAIPNYLPQGANKRRIVLSSLGADIYQITIEYNLNKDVIIFSQQNSANETSRGTLYDTDDTVTKNLSINGSPAVLFIRKNGINTLNWQLRGLLLQITGKLPEEEITKITQSIN
ncbi:DUF4367 domain-containing protein [Desulfosporosinus sp. BG]|uniref:DUF4367 domain-containing protein n=1 Tax=Desulfosporosinus sp. BG TaxID=1633135 RepID=UPI000839EDAC|nr:DUF4367 domain-containing protein [Desulfosporosinus sp. BG]ODA40040.1 hypothetical protein DSBG_3158 [Desulfosporosinus sp. BG]